ncbi:ribonuclease H-like domain-containing protein [Tanacetum coccineum]
MVRSMWLFKHKFHANGTLSRYKARLVSNGSSQQLGVDFDETFSPVVKPATIRTVLSLVVSRKWPIHQLDVKNAFLNGDLSETVYMHQPPDFVDARFPNHGSQFDMTDLGALNYFLGISVVRHSTCLFLSQRKYALQLLERAHMVNCNPSRTPVDRIQQICLYMHDLQEPHFAALKRILRYVRGTVDFGLQLYISATTSLVAKCQHTLSRFSIETEYRGVANVVVKITWLRNLLRELHSPLSTTTLVYCDNVSAIYMSANHVQYQWTKHIEIDIHFVHDMVTTGRVRVLHVPSRYCHLLALRLHLNTKMKAYSKHIDWGQVKITKDIMEGRRRRSKGCKESGDMTLFIMKESEKPIVKDYTELVVTDGMVDYVLEKYENNWKCENEIAFVILEDLWLKYEKGERIKRLEVDLARAIKAKQVDDHDDDLDTLVLENKIKKLEEDFGRLLKAKKAKEARKANEVELKANKAKEALLAKLKAKEAMLAEVAQIFSDEDPIASTFTRSRAPIASTSNAQAAFTAPRGYRKISMTGCVLALFAPNDPNAPPSLATRKRKTN